MDPVSEHAGSVAGFPIEAVFRYVGVFMFTGSHKNIGIHTARVKKFRQGTGMTERIDVIARRAYLSEVFIIIKLVIHSLNGMMEIQIIQEQLL